MQANPQLGALALLLRKFGTKIPGGGYEVEVSHQEMLEMSPHGTFQELPEMDRSVVKWQYFPNPTVEGVGGTVKGVSLPDHQQSYSEQGGYECLPDCTTCKLDKTLKALKV